MGTRARLGKDNRLKTATIPGREGRHGRIASFARLLTVACATVTAAAGCGEPQSAEPALTVTHSALTAVTDVFGFESPANWSTTTSGVALSQSTKHSQGSFSLQVKPSSSNGFTPIASVPLSTLSGVSPTLAWDVMLPTQQANPNWFGTAQMYLNCPSRNIFSQFLGQVDLTGKPLNVWNTVSFSLTNTEVTGLLQAGYTDLTVTVVLNVQVPTTGVYFIDNLRFIPLATNACGGWPNGTSCTDGNACTQTDTCQAGLCKGSNPVVCPGPDQCHGAGTCNASTGICSNPPVANGTACNDGNACTQTDTCQAGLCKGSNPIVCPQGNQCNTEACDPGSGTCAPVPVANGTSCNDGNTCTAGDTCQGGVCGGTADSLCQLSIRFEEIVDQGNGVKTAIFSYANPGATSVSAPYGSTNFISVNGQMVTTAPSHVPTSFAPGDHPGALSFPLPSGATTVSWTLGAHVATASGAATPLGTTSTGAPAVTLKTAGGSPLVVAFDTANDDVSPAVVFSVSSSTIEVPQGGSAAVTLNVEDVGSPIVPTIFHFIETDVGPSGLNDRQLPEGTATPPSAFNWVFQADPAAPLGQHNISLSLSDIVPGNPSVSLTVTVVPPVVSTVSLAFLSMTAPLTMQGVQSWGHFVDIDNNRPGGGGIEPFLNYTTTPIPPFISDPNAPRWVKDNGFAVQDELGVGFGGVSSVPKVLVDSSHVNFQVGLGLTDDTSALAITSTPDTFNNPFNVNTGVVSCNSSLFPGVVEGNHGKYTVRIESWQDGATNCQASETLDPDYPSDQVTFDGPSPDAAAGCWVPVNTASADLYGSQPLPDIAGAGINGPSAVRDNTVETVLSVPVTLSGISSYLRYVVSMEEADTRVPTDTNVIGWDTTRRYPDAFSCEEWANFNSAINGLTAFTPNTTPTTGQGYDCAIGNDPNNLLWDTGVPFCPPAVPKVVLPGENSNEGPLATWRFTRPLVNGRPQQQTFTYETASNPFQVVLDPAALVEMKVLPWTILYQPPGDKSSATYAITNSYGINMTTTNLVTQNQSTVIDNKVTDGDSEGLNPKNIIPPSAFSDGLMDYVKSNGFSAGVTISSSNTWDNSTTVGSGRSTQAAVSNAANFQTVQTFTLSKNGNSSLIPGATGTYAQEPFWDDTFLLLVHPQFGIWQTNGANAVVLLGAQGGVDNPNVFPATVQELDSCARRAPGFENGLPITTSTHGRPGSGQTSDSTDVLDANDCLQLLQLDPFYGVGQTIPMAPNARIVAAQSVAGAVGYGTSGDTSNHSDLNVSLQQTITYTNLTTVTNIASYNAAVSAAATSSLSGSLSLAGFGLSFSPSDTDSQTTTNTNTWTIQFQSSLAATASSSTAVTGVLDDDHIFPVKPSVFVFQDAVFGGFMFQDPAAPLAPAP
ncbi:MAG TPA: hypothetical protein VHO06_08835 [Polyangia bacterium]|nr:hypothetical protein [Polyangia bacterium]